VAQNPHNSAVASAHHSCANLSQVLADQARSDANRVHRLAKARRISSHAACHLITRQLVRGRTLDEAFAAVEGEVRP
jgi:hypothetical protein